MRSFLLIIQMTYISFITSLMFSLHFGNKISKNKSNNMKMKENVYMWPVIEIKKG